MGQLSAVHFVGMFMAEFAQVGLLILSKAAMSDGMSNHVFVFYSNALASLVLLPSSLLSLRSNRPPITFPIIARFFLLGLLGYFAQFFGYTGIDYSSPTLASTMLNLIPGLTFTMAIIFRMEKVDWRSSTFLAKSLGTIVSITGAFIVTLYKGPPLVKKISFDYRQLFLEKSDWVIGGLFLLGDCLFASTWLIVQALTLKIYPAEVILVLFYFLFVSIQSGAIALYCERDTSAWILYSDTRKIAVLYSGVFGYAFQVVVSTWCLHRTGPVFVAMFKPLGIVVAALASVIFLGDTFYLGSLIGAFIIVIGFYSVMWGKANEGNTEDGVGETSLLGVAAEQTALPMPLPLPLPLSQPLLLKNTTQTQL